MKLLAVPAFLTAVLAISPKAAAQTIDESFDDVSSLASKGWVIQNNSAPLGSTTWNQGIPTTATPDPGPFNANSGATNAYIRANFASTTGGNGVISTWLIAPNRTLGTGTRITFYTRTTTVPSGGTRFPDRLEVRLSTNGSSTDVGTGANDVGNFTTLLLSINPNLQNAYPDTWTQYTITLSGLPGPTVGRIAFRYFVTRAGPSGDFSDYIGIDDVVIGSEFCGNGALGNDEECDDGNSSNTDACLNDCVEATCGDGYVRDGVEECDDTNTANDDACLNTCRAASCGDGFTQTGVEDCDDANEDNTDACLETCVAASCGDGHVHAGVELCDDANDDNTDACSTTCAVASCGDGFVQDGVEQCDDANAIETDDCLSTCVTAFCGDGYVHDGVEPCDDGNTSDNDACSTSCVAARCGDGVVQNGVEACDDGNAVDTDACLTTCALATCGDHVVQDGVEECDGTAGCTATCTVEIVTPPGTDPGGTDPGTTDPDGTDPDEDPSTTEPDGNAQGDDGGCQATRTSTSTLFAVMLVGLAVRVPRRRLKRD